MGSKKHQQAPPHPVSSSLNPLEAAKGFPEETPEERQAREEAQAAAAAKAEQESLDAQTAAKLDAEAKAKQKADDAKVAPMPPKPVEEARYRVDNPQRITISYGAQMVPFKPGTEFGFSRFGGTPGIRRLRDAGLILTPLNDAARAADEAPVGAPAPEPAPTPLAPVATPAPAPEPTPEPEVVDPVPPPTSDPDPEPVAAEPAPATEPSGEVPAESLDDDFNGS